MAEEDAAAEAVAPTRLAEDVQRRAEGRALRAAVDALPEKQRTVVLLHYFEEYSCEEIALLLDCSVGTVWSRLHYGCRKLRDQLRWLEEEMNGNRENVYRTWLIPYLEGTLDAEQRRQVGSRLGEDPDLAAEMELLRRAEPRLRRAVADLRQTQVDAPSIHVTLAAPA